MSEPTHKVTIQVVTGGGVPGSREAYYASGQRVYVLACETCSWRLETAVNRHAESEKAAHEAGNRGAGGSRIVTTSFGQSVEHL